MRRLKFEVGQKVGNCTYQGGDFYNKELKKVYANFMCECGTVFLAETNKVKSQHTRSCGCLFSKQLIERNITHGLSNMSEHRIWSKMKERCNNPNIGNYKRYGGRGIKVCDRWNSSFENFFKDMGRRPSKDHSLDRYPDNNGNYEPENCRWATKYEQANNTRTNVYIEYQGQTKTLMEWSRILGFDYHSLKRRVRTLEWSIEKAFSTPINKKKCQK